MIRSIILLTSFCLIFLSSVGQGGFKGKKNYVMYSNHIGYHSDLTYNLVFNDFYFDQEQLGKGYHFYFNHNIELHRIISDRGELIVFYGFGGDSKPANPINILSSNTIFSSFEAQSDLATRRRFGAKYRWYSKNGLLGLAPLHLFNEVGLSSINTTREIGARFEDQNTQMTRTGTFNFKHQFIGVSWGVGYQEIIKDQFIIGSGLSFNYPIKIGESVEYPDGSENIVDGLNQPVVQSFRYQELVKATVSIGFLF